MVVEQFSKGENLTSFSPLPITGKSQSKAASVGMAAVPTNQEKPRSGGAEGISRRHRQGDI